MRVMPPKDSPARRPGAAFTLVELMVAITVIAISFASVYLGISSAFGIVQSTRDDLRATQILNEKMETMRLYTWTQITNGIDIPSGFTNYYYETGNASQGTRYIGTVAFSAAGFNNSYSGGMRRVTVSVRWTQGSRTNLRETMSLVSSNGLQAYILE